MVGCGGCRRQRIQSTVLRVWIDCNMSDTESRSVFESPPGDSSGAEPPPGRSSGFATGEKNESLLPIQPQMIATTSSRSSSIAVEFNSWRYTRFPCPSRRSLHHDSDSKSDRRRSSAKNCPQCHTCQPDSRSFAGHGRVGNRVLGSYLDILVEGAAHVSHAKSVQSVEIDSIGERTERLAEGRSHASRRCTETEEESEGRRGKRVRRRYADEATVDSYTMESAALSNHRPSGHVLIAHSLRNGDASHMVGETRRAKCLQ